MFTALLWNNFTIQPGVNQSCGYILVPDNECLDKKDREFPIIFSVDFLSPNTTVIFEDRTASLCVVDDDSKP